MLHWEFFENHKFDLLNDSLKKYSTYGSYLPNKEKVSNKMIDAMANFGRRLCLLIRKY